MNIQNLFKQKKQKKVLLVGPNWLSPVWEADRRERIGSATGGHSTALFIAMVRQS
jgi:hypothetical protein